MTADERLAAIRKKIERAKHHINEVKALVKGFQSSKPYTLAIEQNPQPPRYQRFQVRLVDVAPLPDALPLVVGDCFHNLRGALDHLVYQLVLAHQRDVVP